jgi:hypothetical protein
VTNPKRKVLTPQSSQMLAGRYGIYVVADVSDDTSKQEHDYSTRAEESNRMASCVAPVRSGAPASTAHQRASESYRRRAAECLERSVLSQDVAKRLNYFQLAEYWNDMARDAEMAGRIRRQPLRDAGR